MPENLKEINDRVLVRSYSKGDVREIALAIGSATLVLNSGSGVVGVRGDVTNSEVVPESENPIDDLNMVVHGPDPQTSADVLARSPLPKYIPTYNLPYPPSPNFVGREGVLARLRERLPPDAGAISPARAIAVAGMAGVGKTELALQYASKYGKSYGGGCYWLEMGDRVLADVLAQHLKDEFNLDLPPEKADRTDRAQWCWQQWERRLPEDSTVLVVLDRVDEAHQIGGMLPDSPRFRLLVTTRQRALDDTFAEELLEELTDVAALEFLEKLVADRIGTEPEAAKRLCRQVLGNLPLGIELSVAISLNNLAEIYKSQGRYSAAEPLYRRALHLKERRLGADHPFVANNLNHLAALYQFQGRYSEAEPLYAKALKICEQSLGIGHLNTMTVRENYALCLRRERL